MGATRGSGLSCAGVPPAIFRCFKSGRPPAGRRRYQNLAFAVYIAREFNYLGVIVLEMEMRYRAWALIVLALTFAAARAEARPIVWVAPALTRVGQEDAARDGTRIELWAGRGEYESFQVIVRGAAAGLADATISVSDLSGLDGRKISRNNLLLYREQYVHIAQGSPDRGGTNRPLGPGWYADALIPLTDSAADGFGGSVEKNGDSQSAIGFREAAGKNQPFWVDVFVPRSAKSGEYRGTVSVADKDGVVAVRVTLHVWNFELPLRPSLRSAFWIFDNAASKPPISYAGQAENQKLLLEHKIMPLSVDPAMEREFEDHYGLNFTLLKWFDTASYGHCTQPPPPSVADLLSLQRQHQSDLPLYVYLGDEITQCTNIFPVLKQWSANVRRAGLTSMLTAVPVPELREDGNDDGHSVADIWVLLPKQFVSSAADVAAVRNKGDQFWAYTAVVQDSFSPKWAIDFSPANYRILGGFLSQSQGVSGLLYWAVNSWAIHATADPWNNLIYKQNAPGIPPGEGWLVYPSASGEGFVPSMRLKWIRKSAEDYEYVEMLKKAGRGEWALQIAKSVAGDWEHWSQEPDAIEKARRQLGEELDRVGSGRVSIQGPRSH
jgi:hypothetical protein